MSTFVLPLADPKATLEYVGGKGMSLAKMAQVGLPIPGGFHLTTEAYRCFVADNELQPHILSALERVDPGDPARLETASQQISQLFIQGTIPAEIARSVTAAYTALGGDGLPVAVRSSATAEDLPGASFAGQQETYLNICGAEAVLEAVKKCWASLWTARAIAYRARQGIAPETVALAVVVQALVFAEAAGVLFTANPVSGSRDEMMITATWGLGEALVGGLVTPDTLTVDRVTGKVLSHEISLKQVMTVRTAAGTEEQPVPQRLAKSAVLKDTQAAELARLGTQIEQLYGMPMDIEWALAGNKFAIVQARPVTTLLSEAQPATALKWVRTNPKAVLARGSFAEFVPDPVSPLFATLAVPIAEAQTQKFMGDFFQVHGPDSYVFDVVNGYVYIGMVFTPGYVWKMVIASTFQAKKVLETGMSRWAGVREKCHAVADKWQGELTSLPAPMLLEGARELFQATAEYYTVAQSGPIPAGLMSEMIFSRFYSALVKGKSDPAPVTFLLGLETIALRAEKSLYDLAMWVKKQPELAGYLQQMPTKVVCADLRADPVPAPLAGEFVQRLSAHLGEFGHTIYDLDFAKPVPADDPAPLLDAMKAYLAGSGISPYERQRAQVERREQAEQSVLNRLDPLRRKWFSRLLCWAQTGGPAREDCIADLGLTYPQLHRLLRELGRRLADGGAITRPEDVYWLEIQEVEALAAALEAGEALTAYSEPVERRKAFWQRVRKINPPITLPDKAFFSKLLIHDNREGNILKGYAASAGKVTARACVLHGPESFGDMRPGDVIVAVTTTPAWTPLFAMASAVVTDIGGPLSHSSIVAREYGIPAVMATGSASKRIQNGQMITVDGSAGTVTLEVEHPEVEHPEV